MTDSIRVCTDLLDDEVGDILKVSEGRWQIEECFRIMVDFARPVYSGEENRIKAHLLICFLALVLYRFLKNWFKILRRTARHSKSNEFCGDTGAGDLSLLYKQEA